MTHKQHSFEEKGMIKMEEKKKRRMFVTGDTHCPHDIHKLNARHFPTGKELTKDDIVTICGDAGFVWDGSKGDEWWIKWIDKKPWTTVYVPGNHENYDMLKMYPIVEFMGAKARKIGKSLYCIERGEIMTVNGKSFFCFGGAFSHDREDRVEGKSWWADELPTQAEIDHGWEQLRIHHGKVDYIVTHDVPTEINLALGYNFPNMDNYDPETHKHICQFFQDIYNTIDFKVWFAGHYHVNQKIDKVQVLYDDIVEMCFDSEEECDGGLIPHHYLPLCNLIKRDLTEFHSKEEMRRIAEEQDLYISHRQINKKGRFQIDEFETPLAKYIDEGMTKNELLLINELYQHYLKIKDTYYQNEK